MSDDLWEDRRLRVKGDDTITGDVRIAITKLSERYAALADDMHEMKQLLTTIQTAVNAVLVSRGGDVQLQQDMAELKKAVAEISRWHERTKGMTLVLRAIGGLVTMAVGYSFLTQNQHDKDIAALSQQVADHVKEDRKAREDHETHHQ